mmetsp:Transcript_20953/g.53257  ORF Transcript_20953/g.53257 Transcript_20953/m.53257 type:complete len:285 (-) Transcript_20953:480-1334(-)
MRVHVDALALRLLQQQLQVVHVVAGDEDGLARLGCQVHRGGGGVAKGARVGLGQVLHDGEVDLAHAQRHGQHLAHVTRAGARQERQALGHKRVHGGVGLAQRLGVVRVRGHALEPVHHQLLQPRQRVAQRGLAHAHIGGGRGGDEVAHAGCLGHVPQQRVRHAAPELGHVGGGGRRHAGSLHLGGQHLLQPLALVQELVEARVVKVDVGERGEDGAVDEGVDLGVLHAVRACVVRQAAQALHLVHEQVLQASHLGRLAAHAHFSAARTVECLLALVAEHLVVFS